MENKKIGICGGGQLGKMLCQAASKWNFDTYVVDASPEAPAAPYCNTFVPGHFGKFDDVMRLSSLADIITVEIETVNTDALKHLKQSGKAVHPDPESLEIIRDKGRQRLFFQEHGFPQPDFALFMSKEEILTAMSNGRLTLPFVQKARTGGYDGRGVAVLKRAEDLHLLMDGPSIVESFVDIKMELGVIAARNPGGQVAVYEPVEMVFDPQANLVDYLLCPARISHEMTDQVKELARKAIEALDLCGLLAVEVFLDDSGGLLLNEVAPRPHNSGHHTIESAATSQFEQHLRAICDLPLGSTAQYTPAAMVNILGAPGHSGTAKYHGIDDVLAMDGTHVHIYGKKMTKPWRKMGHVTITGDSIDTCIEKCLQIKKLIRVTT